MTNPNRRNDMHRDDIIPIPLRADVIVRFHGVPLDMTAAEADKICRVIRAMALEKQHER